MARNKNTLKIDDVRTTGNMKLGGKPSKEIQDKLPEGRYALAGFEYRFKNLETGEIQTVIAEECQDKPQEAVKEGATDDGE